MILAGDIGGTKVNLGFFELRDRRLAMTFNGSFPSRRYARLQDLVKEFLAGLGTSKVERACFGVAGPVINGQAQVTNLPWKIEAAELARELNFGSVSLINDLGANGYGLAELTPADLCVLNEGQINAPGNAAIISAGTGLGEAGLFWDGQKHHPFSCEGGHADFAPVTKLDAELFTWLGERFGHISYERVLSGTGLYNIYQFLRDTKRGDEPVSLAKEIADGDPGASSRCSQALDMFIGFYGAEAGNLGLKLMATGGVYIGGGIAPKILPLMQKGTFMTAFFNKGRMEPLMKSMPVRVVLNPATALLGAAHYAAYGPQSITNPLPRP
jgi:glucokinase